MNLIQLMNAAIGAHAVEGGFENFYQDLVIMEPLPGDQWTCGDTVQIKWNKGMNITNGTATVPATPASGNINIHLVSVGTPWAQNGLKKYTLAVDVPIDDEVFDFHVDCEGLPRLCDDCLDKEGALKMNEGRIHQRWNYLLFEDTDLLTDPADECKRDGLNYDNDNCWSVRSEGGIQIVTEAVDQRRIPEEEVFSIERYWMNDQTPPLGQHLWGVSTAMSQRAAFHIDQGMVLELPNYGTWDIVYAYYRAVVAVSVWRSREDNVLAVVFRPTSNGELNWDDWMSNFTISQRSCDGLIENCDPKFKFHRGFLYEHEITKQGVRDAVMKEIVEVGTSCDPADPTPWRVLFTGMSQGGGLASLGFYDVYNYTKAHMDSLLWDKLAWQLYTTGSAITGNEHYALWVEDTLPKWARERFVTRFDTTPEDGVTKYSAGPMKVDDFSVLFVDLLDMNETYKCMNRQPPLGPDTPPYAGWKWQTREELGLDETTTDDDLAWENAVSWQDGDIVTLMRSNAQCKGVSGSLMFDSRFTRVQDPVYVHWDPDHSHIWCTEDGCEPDPAGHVPPHPNAKEPGRLYTTGYAYEPQNGQRKCMNTVGPASDPGMSCHDLGLYAHGISMQYNTRPEFEDYIGWRNDGVDFAGCKATGVMVPQEQVEYVRPETTYPPYLTESHAMSALATTAAFLWAFIL